MSMLVLLAGIVGLSVLHPTLRRRYATGTVLSVLLFQDVVINAIEARSGTNISDAGIVAAVSLFGMFAAILQKNDNALGLLRSRAFWAIAVFSLYACSTIAWSADTLEAITKAKLYIGFCVIPGIALAALNAVGRPVSWRLPVIAGALTVVLVMSLGEFSVGRLSTPGGNPIWIGRAALVVASLAFWSEAGLGSYSRLVVGVTAIGVAVATGARGPLLSFMFVQAIFVAGLPVESRVGRRKKLAALVALVAITGAFTVYAATTDADDSGSVAGRLVGLTKASAIASDVAVQDRLVLQSQALALFSQSPVLGAGLGSNGDRTQGRYPHNLVLELASETGLVGLLLAIAAVVYCIMAARGMRMFQLLIVQLGLYSMTSGDLIGNASFVVVCFGAAGIHSRLRTTRGTARSYPALATDVLQHER